MNATGFRLGQRLGKGGSVIIACSKCSLNRFSHGSPRRNLAVDNSNGQLKSTKPLEHFMPMKHISFNYIGLNFM
ncbi:hypothetical protein QQP08_023160 [Theobroma cacao]|nr:hypothetical protein QQP08_023160 [Theobroma cacao]